MQAEKLEILFQRFISKTATEAERNEFFELVKLPGANEALMQLTERYALRDDHLMELPQQVSDEILSAILSAEDMPATVEKPVRPLRRFWWAAAAIVILVAVGGVLFVDKMQRQIPAIIEAPIDIKAPQLNRATIALPDGYLIMLDSVANGTLIAGIVRKIADGQLVFEGNKSNVAYIIATNPRNSTAIQLSFPDSTKVWLNADTHLQYPTNYSINERMVTLDGEAYFEVRHNVAKPFRVIAGEQTIEDAGTIFNVKAYKGKAAVQTTLLEGQVKINNTVTLKPGQKYSRNKITDVNTEEVTAWKNGSFYLDGCEFGEIANEMGRWYDVEVVFTNPATMHSIVAGGEIGRNLSLVQVIGILKELNVNCRLEGRRLIVE